MPAIAEILAPGTATPVDDDARAGTGDKIGVAQLVQLFEEAEDATITARGLSERDRDYYDGKQLTATELKALKDRGQPPVIANAICRKINYLVGVEKEQRVKPKAMPRTPQHEADADSATQALRYVIEDQDYGTKRSGVWKNMLIEGAGGIAVAVKPSKYQPQPMAPQPMMGVQPSPQFGGDLVSSTALTAPGGQQFDVELRRIPWDRMFADPHSSEADYSDATYLGVVLWMDFNDALDLYGEDNRDILEWTLRDSGQSQTYDDKPKFRVWADKARKRVRIVQIWIKRGEEWHFAEFTKGGILKAGPSPYKTDTGESDGELVFQSAYVNRDNERYGEVRAMISPQDEVNKRRSKALHLINTNQTLYEEGAVDDINLFRKEAAKPDGTMKVNPGALTENRIKIETRTDLAEAQFKLLLQSSQELDLAGPNATQLGDKTQGSSSASGKAIIASQQGGMIQMGDILDNLRHMDVRVFRKVWHRIRQFWTAEKWIRVTDDERNLRWVGLNTNMEVVQDPATGQSVTRPKLDQMGNPMPPARLAELDCDITIDDTPDGVTPQLEQFQALAEAVKGGLPIPPDVMIEAMPNLNSDTKAKILDRLEQPNPMAQMQQQLTQIMGQLQVALGHAKVQETQARTQDIAASADKKRAETMATMRESMMPEPGVAPEMPEPLAHEQAAADIANTMADTDLKRANEALTLEKIGQTRAQTAATRQQTAMRPAEFAAGRQDAADRNDIAAARAAKPPSNTLQ